MEVLGGWLSIDCAVVNVTNFVTIGPPLIVMEPHRPNGPG
jgi:hypothetical protein